MYLGFFCAQNVVTQKWNWVETNYKGNVHHLWWFVLWRLFQRQKHTNPNCVLWCIQCVYVAFFAWTVNMSLFVLPCEWQWHGKAWGEQEGLQDKPQSWQSFMQSNATLAQTERVFWGIFITLAVMNYCLCNHLLSATVCLAALQASTLARASRNKKRAKKWCDDRSENRKHPLLSNTQDAAKMLHNSAAQTVL